jgi:ADP-ribose pyrophosphatase
MGNNTNVLSGKTIFQSKYFKVTQIVVERNGKTFTKDIVERNPFVLILPITPDNEIYLVSQYRDALQKVSLEVIAGLIEPEEDPLVAAKRELQEETGLIAENVKPLLTGNVSPNMVNGGSVFVATELTQGKTDQDEDEDIQVVKMPIAQALKKIETGELSILTHIAALLLFVKLQKEEKF